MASPLPLGVSSPTMETRGDPGPRTDFDVWTDSFDDLVHVYVPPSGLVGVEVVGGQDKIDALLQLLSPMGIKKVARSGILALYREPS